MIVHLTCARETVATNIDNLRLIIKSIHESGNVLARDWIEPQWHMIKNVAPDPLTPEEIYNINLDAVERADIVIIDATHSSFGAGYQAAIALQQKKPTLLMWRQGAHQSNFSLGATDPLLTKRSYTDQNIEKVVISFLRDNTFRAKDLRFNFVIDNKMYNFLRKRSGTSGKTKAEIIRDLLLKDIQKS